MKTETPEPLPPPSRPTDPPGASRRTVLGPGAAAVLAAALVAGGCATTPSLSGDPADYGSSSAEAAVRSFFDGVQERNYRQMGQQFGTREGPAEERLGISEVEQRMVVLEGVLRHQEYDVRRADLAQVGRNRTRFLVTLTGTRYGQVQLPVVAVQTEEGRWFVEQIDTEPLGRTTGR